MSKRPKNACLMLTGPLMVLVGLAATNDCDVIKDDDAGTIEVKDGDDYVLRAIQKGNKMQPWIVMFYETDRIKWGDSKAT